MWLEELLLQPVKTFYFFFPFSPGLLKLHITHSCHITFTKVEDGFPSVLCVILLQGQRAYGMWQWVELLEFLKKKTIHTYIRTALYCGFYTALYFSTSWWLSCRRKEMTSADSQRWLFQFSNSAVIISRSGGHTMVQWLALMTHSRSLLHARPFCDDFACSLRVYVIFLWHFVNCRTRIKHSCCID